MLRRDSRMTQRDRHELEAAVLGVRRRPPAAGARVNAGFPQALQQLVQEILRVQEAECACERLDVASKATVVFAVDQLRFNINANVSGAAPMRIRELLLDLETVQEILANPEVVGQVACGHRDGVLAVVNILNGLDPSVTPNAVAISRADDACTDLLALVADNYTNLDDNTTFDRAVEAATTLDAAEAWLTGRPRAVRAELVRPGDGRSRVTGAAARAAIPDRGIDPSVGPQRGGPCQGPVGTAGIRDDPQEFLQALGGSRPTSGCSSARQALLILEPNYAQLPLKSAR